MTLITGGSKCGRSAYAERLLDGHGGRKVYIAAMKPYGEEAMTAIKRHRLMRAGKGFETIEKYTDIHELILPEKSAVLLECLPNLLANEMFGESFITDPSDKIISGIKKINSMTQRLVVVTGELGCDGGEYSLETGQYIKILAKINRIIAMLSDNVVECVYGLPYALKGRTEI